MLENNQSAPQFELRLKNRELQKKLFDYIGAGTITPNFLVEKLYEEENKKLEIDFINLESFYKKKENITDQDLKNFVKINKDQLKVDYISFGYAVINPKNLLGINEFNQNFFDKIDQIEIDISNNINFNTIVSNLNLKPINVTDFKLSSTNSEIEKKIFEFKENNFDIFENGNDYIIYKINDAVEKEPDLSDIQTKNEIRELVFKKNKFDYNNDLLQKIGNNEFNNNDFLNYGENKIETTKLNSIKDNNKFEINAVEVLYSLPINSFALINDENNIIYLAKIKKFDDKLIDQNDNSLKEYRNKQNSNNRNTLLKSYDLFLNNKYNINLNQKTIIRVINFFQ